VILDFSAYRAERAGAFTGREWVLDAVAAWRADPAGERCLLITGEPGAGKTAIAARLADQADAVHFRSARDRRWINPRTFAESVSGQLAAARPAFAAARVRRGGAAAGGPVRHHRRPDRRLGPAAVRKWRAGEPTVSAPHHGGAPGGRPLYICRSYRPGHG
jgi:hypothetical protein